MRKLARNSRNGVSTLPYTLLPMRRTRDKKMATAAIYLIKKDFDGQNWHVYVSHVVHDAISARYDAKCPFP